jgi:hypothetical protein
MVLQRFAKPWTAKTRFGSSSLPVSSLIALVLLLNGCCETTQSSTQVQALLSEDIYPICCGLQQNGSCDWWSHIPCPIDDRPIVDCGNGLLTRMGC